MPEQSIFDWIKSQETAFGLPIEVQDNWQWCMKDHIKNSILMKHGKFIEATNELNSKNPYKNVIYPLLNLRYRAEDIDLKDVVLYADDDEKFHLSFLVKKYHDEVYIREHDLDTFFDETKEEKIDLGACLVRKGVDGPLYEPLDSIAFCDQTDILSGPICFKEFYSPDELLEKEAQGWGSESNGANVTLDELVTLAEQSKTQDAKKPQKTKTPGKYVEVYRVHGSLPSSWLNDSETKKFTRQLQIIAFYKNQNGEDQGVTLYKKREYENPFKVHLSGKKIRNRALAYGGVEELIEPQIWTNFSEIHKKNFLEAASKVIPWTDDSSLANKNSIRDMENLQLLTVEKGSQVGVLNNGSPNVSLFNEWIKEWEVEGQTVSGATEALLGKNPVSGTPFALQSLVTQNGMGLHDYRKGKFATFIEQIYTDWIIPDIAKKVSNGTKFLASLSSDELEYVSDCLVRSELNKWKKQQILSGIVVQPEQEQQYEQTVRAEFARGGNKKFLEILKGETEGIVFKVKVNVAGKQKDLAGIVDKMTNIFRQIFMNPAILDNPKAAKVFNKLVEYSGMDPIDFGYASSKGQQNQPQMMPKQMQPSPVQQTNLQPA